MSMKKKSTGSINNSQFLSFANAPSSLMKKKSKSIIKKIQPNASGLTKAKQHDSSSQPNYSFQKPINNNELSKANNKLLENKSKNSF